MGRRAGRSMSSLTIIVLSLALVFSIIGSALEVAVHDTNQTLNMNVSEHMFDEIHNGEAEPEMLKNRTNIDQFNIISNYSNNLGLNNKSNNVTESIDDKIVIDKVNKDNEVVNGASDKKLNEYDSEIDEVNKKIKDYESKIDNADKIMKTYQQKAISTDEDYGNYKTNKYVEHSKFSKYSRHFNVKKIRQYNTVEKKKSRGRRELETDACDEFQEKDRKLTHPHTTKSNLYANNVTCTTVLKANDGEIIQLTFVDIFHIEEGPDGSCPYDYLEIRDGNKGYAKLIKKLCGNTFPPQITSSGPYLWLKFHSDDTIEYDGFHIQIKIEQTAPGNMIPEGCNHTEEGKPRGTIISKNLSKECELYSVNRPLEAIWTIVTPKGTKILLNFTHYSLAMPNECEKNVVQVYGYELEYEHNLAHYCGSVANSLTTKSDSNDENGNIMYIRMYAAKAARDSAFNATYTAFWTLDPNKDGKCQENQFSCEDNTCIEKGLECDNYGDCRLKTDEDPEICSAPAKSMTEAPHIVIILVIFSLLLSGMGFVFFFKCIKKLYQDHKIIKEHIKQSTEDRLDALGIVGSRMTLNAGDLQKHIEPRASLERDNHTNEMFKKQRKLSQQRRPSSIDSDYVPETHLDVDDDEPWIAKGDTKQTQEIMIEKNGRTRRNDTSKREESLRSKTQESEPKSKEIRDVSVGAPDTKESGCQTRESLFQTEPAPSSDGSGSNSRGLSTFGYSGATIARPSPPAANKSEITIELLKQMPHQDSTRSQKKIPDRRPMSTETTRSAPDVIIVSKPIR